MRYKSAVRVWFQHMLYDGVSSAVCVVVGLLKSPFTTAVVRMREVKQH